MDIYIFGDLDFAYFILNGITMLYTGDSTFIQAGLILSLLFFLWSFIKWGLNPEKTTYPVREWAFGLIFFLIFGGTAISPKFNVNLIHATSGNFRTISDVPVLAAAPSWLATNLFRTITNKIESAGALVNPGYERFRGYGIPDKPSADPLNALVKLNTLANTVLLDRHLETGIQRYIDECYLPHITFTGGNALSFSKRNIDDPAIWDDLLVNNPYLNVETIDAAGNKQTYLCSVYHAEIKAGIRTDDSTPGLTQSAMKAARSRDIHPQEIEFATQIIYQNLVGSTGSPNPYTIGTNMFLARSIKDSINGSPEAATMQAWSNKMVFEAERKRTFEAAGERSLFMKIYIPTITAIECFSFFIAPILMILSVLGGYGFSLIGKYLMLVLFINLWSFIKVFVDIFTALALSQAFKPIGSVPPADQVKNHLAFDVYPQTIAEIESMLTLASNLTMAIPFFAMFLLYGGIHSVMGVMRTVTGGSVDGSNMAPTMATSMNAATIQMGDTQQSMVVSTGQFAQSHNPGTDARYGSTIASNSSTSGAGGATQLIRSQINTETSGFNQALSTAFTNATKASTLQSSGSTETATNNRGVTWMEQTSDTFSGSYINSQSQTAQILSRLAATLGGKIAAGSSTGSQSDPEKQRELLSVTSDPTKKGIEKSLVSMGLSADVAGQLVAGMTEDDVKTFSQQVNTAKQNATQFMKNENFAGAEMYSDLQAYMKEVTKSDSYNQGNTYAQTISRLENQQATIGTNFSNDKGLTNSSSLAWNVLDPSYATFQAVYNNLNDNQRQRLAELGLGNDGYSVANSLAAGDPNVLGNGVLLSQRLIDNVNKKDNNLETAASDAKIAAGIFNTLGQLAGPVYGNGFNRAAESNLNLSDILTGTDKANNTLKPDTSSVKTGPLTNTIQGFDANGNPISGVNKQQAQNAIGSEVPSTVAGSSNVVPITTPEQLKEMQQNQYRDLSTIRSGGMAMNDVYGGFLNSVGDFMSLFKSRDLIWGKDAPEIASNLTRYATQELGNKSMALEQGIVSLSQISNFADISKLFDRLNNGDAKQRYEAATQLSQMNDAFTFLNTKEGMSLITQSFSPEDGARLLENARQFDSAMRFNTSGPLNKDTFDALSSARITGAITDNNADMYIKAATSYGVNFTRGSNTDQTYEDGNALRYMLFDAPNSSGDANINQLRDSVVNNRTFAKNIEGISAGYNPDSLYTRQAAAFNIARDEDKLIAANGGYNGLNDYQQGVNLENRDGVIQSSTMNYVMQQLVSTNPDQSTEINAQSMERAFNGSDADRQRIFGVVSTQGPLRIAERYADLGFNLESTKLTYSYSHLDDYAVRTNLSIPKEKLDSLNQNVDERIGQLPSFSDKLKPN